MKDESPDMNQVEAKVVTVTPELARQLRDTCHYERQRTLRPRNTKRLSLEMKGGRFIQGTAATFCRLPDGTMILVNANHTLEAIVDSGIPQRMVFIVISVADLDEVARIYGTFDIQRSRTWGDAMKAKALDEKVPMATKVMPALGEILNRFEYAAENVAANDSRQVRFDLMEQYIDEATMIHEALAGAPSLHRNVILRKSVLAVALETARFQPGKASEFWGGAAHDDKLANGDPRKTLIRWLVANPMSAGGSGARSQARAAAICWNAWFEGRTINAVRHNSMVNFRIVGTPWGKGGGESVPAEFARDKVEAVDPVQVDLPETNLDDLFSFGLFAHANGLKPVTYGRQKSP
jgi:hypothetical protein